MVVLKALFWASLAALLWTHLGYALVAGLAARVRRRGVQRADITPAVSVVIAAHDEEDVIERRVRNLLELDYPVDQLEVVVASDASTDRTDEIVERLAGEDRRVRPVRCPRAGKVAAPRRLRPGRGLGREAVPRPRGRVPTQGADAARRVGARIPRHAAPRGPALLRRARLAPPPPLRERPAARGPARVERGPGRRGLDLPWRPACATRVARSGRGRPAPRPDPGGRARLLLPARDLGDDRRARALRPLRPPAALGADRGHAVNR